MLCGQTSIYLGWRYACRKCTDSYNHEMGEAKTKPKLCSSRGTSGHEATSISQLAENGPWWAIKDSEFLPHSTAPAVFLQWPHACVWQARMVTTYNPTGCLAMPSGRHTAGKWTQQPKCCTLQRPDARQCARKMNDGGR